MEFSDERGHPELLSGTTRLLARFLMRVHPAATTALRAPADLRVMTSTLDPTLLSSKTSMHTQTRCCDPDCQRLIWRGRLCWWCWQQRHPGVLP